MRIDSFCRKLKHSYPRTKAVNEQIEELRELLLTRKEELLRSPPVVIPFSDIQRDTAQNADVQAQAEENAVMSLGDVRELFDVILQKSVYNSRMEFCASAISTLILIAVSVAACGVLYALYGQQTWFNSSLLSGIVGIMVGIIVPFTLFLSECIQTPQKITIVSYNAKTLRAALIGWSAIAIICLFINYVTGGEFPWAVFPIVGVADWPLTAVIYNRLFFTRFFEAKG